MNARLYTGITAGVLTIASIAGWYSISGTEAAKRGTVVAALPDKPPRPPLSPPQVMKSVSLTELEQLLVESLDMETGPFSGERFEELFLLNETPGLRPVDRAGAYARAWAEQHPQEFFEWLQRHGGMLYLSRGGASFYAIPVLFKSWAAKDPAAAVKGALACAKADDRGNAMAKIVEVLRKADPARAAALAAEHVALLAQGAVRAFDASKEDYRETMAFMRALPAGKNRGALMARFFDDAARHHRNDCTELWNGLSDEIRREMVAGYFSGSALKGDGKNAPVVLEGLTEMRREFAQSSSDPVFLGHWLRNGALDWAAQDPAAAIAWGQANLKGEQRVSGTAKMFAIGAAADFETTLRAWQELPDGVLKARAAGNLAAGAPAERKAEVAAMLQSLSPGDLKLAGNARLEAQEAQLQRTVKEAARRRIMEAQ